MSAIRTAICNFLQADAEISALAPGGVWPTGIAPKGTAFPYVSVWPQIPPTADLVFQQVGSERAVFLVKAVDQGISRKTVADIAAKIRAILDRAELTIEGYTNLGIIWIQDMPNYPDEYMGQSYQHEGGLYEIYVEAA